MMVPKKKRALLVKFGAIGDCVMLIPAAYELHRAGYEIHWVCGATVAPLLACYRWITVIKADDRSIMTGGVAAKLRALIPLWRRLIAQRYDLCATLYYDSRYRILALPVRAKRKIMLSWSDRALRLLPGRHHSDEYARILLHLPEGERPQSLAPVAPEALPPSPLPPSREIRRVVLVPAGAKNMLRDDGLRRWPAENYAAVARALLADGLEVVLLGGPDDGWAVSAFEGLAVTNLIGTLTLPESIALLDGSDVMVSHDTGPLHLAGITRVGIVSIFGPTDPHYFHPRREGTLAIWGGEGFACRPCYDGRGYPACTHNGCVRQVTPATVVDELKKMLERRARDEESPCRIMSPPIAFMPGTLAQEVV